MVSSSIAKAAGIATPSEVWIGNTRFVSVNAEEIDAADKKKNVDTLAKISLNGLHLLSEVFPYEISKADIAPYKRGFSLILAGSQFYDLVQDCKGMDKIIDETKTAIGAADMLQSVRGLFPQAENYVSTVGIAIKIGDIIYTSYFKES